MLIFLLIVVVGLYFLFSSNKNNEKQGPKSPTNLETKLKIPPKSPEKPSSAPPKPKAYSEHRKDPTLDPEQLEQKLPLINNGNFIVRGGEGQSPIGSPKPTNPPIKLPQPVQQQPVSILPSIMTLSFYQKILKLKEFYEKKTFEAKYKDATVEGQIVCPYDGFPLFKANNANYKGVQYSHCLACEKCKTIFPDRKPKKDVIVDFSSDKDILFVVKTHTIGRNPNHITECVTGILTNESGESIRINVSYCNNCKYHYIYYSEYEQYKLRYGTDFFGNIVFVDEHLTTTGINPQTESILHKYGYNVNASNNLSHEDRVRILRYIISNNILPKEIVISYISYFINRSSNNNKLVYAVSKWKQDLEYIQKFKMETQSKVNLSKVKKRISR